MVPTLAWKQNVFPVTVFPKRIFALLWLHACVWQDHDMDCQHLMKSHIYYILLLGGDEMGAVQSYGFYLFFFFKKRTPN